jgi:IMP dehydrogenase
LIIDPVTLLENATLGDAMKLMRENKIGGIPIIDKNGKLVGILTNRDLRFEHDVNRKVSELMTKENLITAPEGTDLKKAETILRNYKIEKLPVVSKSGKLIGLITYRDILQLYSHPNAVKDKFGRLLVGAGVGITKDILDRVDALQNLGVDIIALDSAHGHSKGVINALKKEFQKNKPHRRKCRHGCRGKSTGRSRRGFYKSWDWTGLHMYYTHRGRCGRSAINSSNGSCCSIERNGYSNHC